MDSIINIGIDIILWLQSLGEVLTAPMKFLSSLGNENFYLLVAPAILWCIDAKLGLRLGLFVMTSGMVNNAFKVAFHSPRPYWYTQDVNVYGVAESSFGVPSGHAQNGVVVWGTIAGWLKKRWVWVLAIVVIFLIGLSRLYLAVHFPHDVLLGWLIGAVLLWVFLRFEQPVVTWMRKYSPGVQVFFAFILSLLLILLVLLMIISLGAWSVPAEWLDFAQQALPEEDAINPLSIYSLMANPGAFFGLAAGWIWLSTQGGFSARGVWWKLIIRYLLGIVGMLALYIGLSAIFPDGELALSIILRYIRYALIGFWAAGLAPWLFVKLNLANGSSPGDLINQKQAGNQSEHQPV